MNDAPETIWAFYAPDIADDNCGATIIAHETIQHGSKCYRRADLPPTLSAAMKLPEVRALVEAAGLALDDLREWLGCSDALIAKGFNIDDTAERAEKLTAVLALFTEPRT